MLHAANYVLGADDGFELFEIAGGTFSDGDYRRLDLICGVAHIFVSDWQDLDGIYLSRLNAVEACIDPKNRLENDCE